MRLKYKIIKEYFLSKDNKKDNLLFFRKKNALIFINRNKWDLPLLLKSKLLKLFFCYKRICVFYFILINENMQIEILILNFYVYIYFILKLDIA